MQMHEERQSERGRGRGREATMTMNVVRGARSPGLQRLSLAESWVTCFPARVTLQARACVPASHQAAPFTLVFARRPCSSIGKTRLRQPARCAPLQRDGISVNLFDNLLVDIIKAIIRNILNGIIFLLEQPKEQPHLEFPTFQSADAKMERESSNSQASETKSDKYSSNMTHAMGAVLTYRHELGMNYNFVLPDLIVGSCLQTPSDVDRLKQMGVKTIFCLQQDPDLEYFGVDICAIQARAKEIRGIEHIRAQIRDFDSFDLRKRLPVVVATLYTAVQRNRGIAYIHCTAGLGRAPAVALTYMHWLLGYDLLDANEMLLSVRPCFPKLEAIRNATCDLLTGAAKEQIQLKWPDSDCQSVEISGLDVGWGQMVPLVFAPKEKQWILNRELLVGKYEYKYVVDGLWTTNPREPLTQPNKDGHINNFVEVIGKFEDAKTKSLRRRLMLDNPELTDIDRKIIRRKLLSLPLD